MKPASRTKLLRVAGLPAVKALFATAPQRVERLFFDPRLSQMSALACVSCHNPSFGWEDGRSFGIGHKMQVLGRSAPTVQNVAWGVEYFWDGRAPTLEQQSVGPIQNPKEMAMDMGPLTERLRTIPGYRARFSEVFPDQGITPENIGRAIATFQRTVVSGPSPFDAWIAGDEKAISDSAKHGFELFNGKGDCAGCHSSWRFTDDGYHDIGLASTDVGRAKIVPGIPALMHAFKTDAGTNVLLTLDLGDATELALPKDIQRHPVRGTFEHVDLVLVRRGEKVTVDVPVTVIGEAHPDAIVDVQSNTVSVTAPATSIPDSIEVTIAGLEPGSSITAGQLALPRGVALDIDAEAVVVQVLLKPTAAQHEAEIGEGEGEAAESAAE